MELNSASVACISVLLKDITMFLTLLNISGSCLMRFYFVMVKLNTEIDVEKRAPDT